MLLFWLPLFFTYVLGLAVGSFLNVVIDRLPKGESVLGGRSYCDHCQKTLAWFDLVPLLSFVWLKGKCRYCGKKLSWQYPIIELATGLLFITVWWWTKSLCVSPRHCFIVALFHCCIVAALIVIFVTDLKYQIIPDHVVYPAILLSTIYLITYHTLPAGRQVSHITYHLVAALGAAGFFLSLYLITKGRGMGFGDVKLAVLMGLFLGWPKTLIAIYFAFLTGALLGVILILTGKKKFGQHIPFGPFLVAGTFVSWFWGERILGYLGGA